MLKMGWLGSISGICHGLLSHCNKSATSYPEHMTLCPHSLSSLKQHTIFDHPHF